MSRRIRFAELLLLVALALALGFAWQKGTAIQDWFKLRHYQPSAQIVDLASQDTMTEHARHLFYINRPVLISDKVQFRDECPVSEQTIVLGCYHGGENGIGLFEVKDKRLDGVEQVTAAHEMLHAAYDRLGAKEKKAVDTQLETFYASGLTDKRVRDTIEEYKKTEPKDVVNEMHSVFGTEVAKLPSGLESYYKKYFGDRSRVTGFARQYEAVFAGNKQQLDNLKTRIADMRSSLAAQQQIINDLEASLAAENSRMQSLLSSGKTRQYNAEVPSYNAQIQQLRSKISYYNSQVSTINDLIEQYNSLAITQESLLGSLDTRLQPAH